MSSETSPTSSSIAASQSATRDKYTRELTHRKGTESDEPHILVDCPP